MASKISALSKTSMPWLKSSIFSRSFSTLNMPNGLKVCTSNSNSDVATVGLFVNSGAAYEDSTNNGATNLFSKIAFSDPKLSEEIENIGGNFWSHIKSREQIEFYGQVPKKNLQKAIEILGRISQDSSLIDETKLDSAKKSLLDDMEHNHKKFDYNLWKNLHSAAFQGSGLSNSIEGTSDSISQINKQSVDSFVKSTFTPTRMSLCVVGNVNSDDVNKYVEANFTGNDTSMPDSGPNDFVGSEIKIWDETEANIKMIFGVEAPGYDKYDTKEFWAFQILKQMIGEHHNLDGKQDFSLSNVAEVLHQDSKLKTLKPFHLPYANTGLFGVYYNHFGDKQSTSVEAVYEILNDWQRICQVGAEKEIAWSKYRTAMNNFIVADNPVHNCADIGSQLLFTGNAISNEQKKALIHSITTTEFKKMTQQYLNDVCPVGVSVGNLLGFPDYWIYRSWMSWSRI